MALAARSGATPSWTITPLRNGTYEARATLTAATDVTEPLNIYDLPINTVHIFGSFGGQNVSLLGFNADPNDATPTTRDAAVATGQVLHQAHAPSSTFSAVAAELLAGVIENPRYIIAKANGAVTAVHIIALAYSQGGR